MRSIPLLLFLAATAAFGSSVGDTYEKVLAEKGAPRSQIEAGSVRILSYADVTIKFRDDVVVSIKAVPAPTPTPTPRAQDAPATTQEAPANAQPSEVEQVATLRKELANALEQVKEIINQPVPTVPITPEIEKKVARWGDIWFHPGSGMPDFNYGDIRKTQDTAMYEKHEFITSNQNPGVAFPGDQVEFNAATKFFYVDRSLPKKRLTEEEMLEVNRLYRVIGSCQARLALLGVQAQLEPASQ
jgi:hypothetical protein